MCETVERGAKPLYTHHGEKRKQGYPINVRGQHAIGYFDHGKLVGYTTLDEIHQSFFGQCIPDFDLNF